MMTIYSETAATALALGHQPGHGWQNETLGAPDTVLNVPPGPEQPHRCVCTRIRACIASERIQHAETKTKFDLQTRFPLSRRPRHVHVIHADADAVEPAPKPYVPASQSVHTPTPAELLYVPDGQRKHDCQCTPQAGHTSTQTRVSDHRGRSHHV